MSKLREEIGAIHDTLKTNTYAKHLMSGNMTSDQYLEVLFNYYHMYDALEHVANIHGLFSDLPNLERLVEIKKDIEELSNDKTEIKLAPATIEYVGYVKGLYETNDIIAHLYIRHFSLLVGGEEIKKVTPGSGNMYNFNEKDILFKNLMNKFNDSMIEESKRAILLGSKMLIQLGALNNYI